MAISASIFTNNATPTVVSWYEIICSVIHTYFYEFASSVVVSVMALPTCIVSILYALPCRMFYGLDFYFHARYTEISKGYVNEAISKPPPAFLG